MKKIVVWMITIILIFSGLTVSEAETSVVNQDPVPECEEQTGADSEEGLLTECEEQSESEGEGQTELEKEEELAIEGEGETELEKEEESAIIEGEDQTEPEKEEESPTEGEGQTEPEKEEESPTEGEGQTESENEEKPAAECVELAESDSEEELPIDCEEEEEKEEDEEEEDEEEELAIDCEEYPELDSEENPAIEGEKQPDAESEGNLANVGEEQIESEKEEELATADEKQPDAESEGNLANVGEEQIESEKEEELATADEKQPDAEGEVNLANVGEERIELDSEEELATTDEKKADAENEVNLANVGEEQIESEKEEELTTTDEEQAWHSSEEKLGPKCPEKRNRRMSIRPISSVGPLSNIDFTNLEPSSELAGFTEMKTNSGYKLPIKGIYGSSIYMYFGDLDNSRSSMTSTGSYGDDLEKRLPDSNTTLSNLMSNPSNYIRANNFVIVTALKSGSVVTYYNKNGKPSASQLGSGLEIGHGSSADDVARMRTTGNMPLIKLYKNEQKHELVGYALSIIDGGLDGYVKIKMSLLNTEGRIGVSVKYLKLHDDYEYTNIGYSVYTDIGGKTTNHAINSLGNNKGFYYLDNFRPGINDYYVAFLRDGYNNNPKEFRVLDSPGRSIFSNKYGSSDAYYQRLNAISDTVEPGKDKVYGQTGILNRQSGWAVRWEPEWQRYKEIREVNLEMSVVPDDANTQPPQPQKSPPVIRLDKDAEYTGTGYRIKGTWRDPDSKYVTLSYMTNGEQYEIGTYKNSNLNREVPWEYIIPSEQIKEGVDNEITVFAVDDGFNISNFESIKIRPKPQKGPPVIQLDKDAEYTGTGYRIKGTWRDPDSEYVTLSYMTDSGEQYEIGTYKNSNLNREIPWEYTIPIEQVEKGLDNEIYVFAMDDGWDMSNFESIKIRPTLITTERVFDKNGKVPTEIAPGETLSYEILVDSGYIAKDKGTYGQVTITQKYDTHLEHPKDLKVTDENGKGIGTATFNTSTNKIVATLNTNLPRSTKVKVTFNAKVKDDAAEGEFVVGQATVSGKYSTGDEVNETSNEVKIIITSPIGVLEFVSAPQAISYGKTLTISPRDKTYPLLKVDMPLAVQDNRPLSSKPSWTMTAKLNKPLTWEGTESTLDSLYYRYGTNFSYLSEDASVQVYNKETKNSEVVNISDTWKSEGDGLYLEVRAGTAKVGNYNGLITWELQDVPLNE